MKQSIKTVIFSALIGSTALVSAAHAGGFAVREQSAEGQGASFAGIAAGGSDLSSMSFNPATITLHKGVNIEGNAAAILPYSKATDGVSVPLVAPATGTNSGNIGKFALVPATYASYQVNEDLFIGFSANAPFGLVTKGNATWAGAWHGIESDLFFLQAGPTVGYKVNDMISVGGAVRGVYSDVLLSQYAGAAGTATLKGDDWGINYSLGLLITPTETTRIGIGFNSKTDIKYKGTARFSGAPVLNSTITAKLKTPETLTIGLRQQVGEDFTVLLGFEWANWSRMKQLNPIVTSGLATLTATPFNWKDSYYYSIGGEYKYSEDTTLRAGFAFEDSPVPDATRGVRIPDANRYWLSIGASHQVNDDLKVSLGYTHIIAENGNVNLPAGAVPSIAATFKQHVNIIAVSGTYNLDKLFH